MNRKKSGIREYNSILISWLLTQSEEVCTSLGVPPEMRARLRHLSVDTLDLDFPHPVALLRCKVFEQLLCLAERHEKRKELVRRALLLGAHYPVLQYYTGMSRTEFQSWLDVLQLNRKPRGRIRLLDEEEERVVVRVWENPDNRREDEMETLCIIAELSGCRLDRIWTFLMPISRAGRKRPPGNMI